MYSIMYKKSTYIQYRIVVTPFGLKGLHNGKVQLQIASSGNSLYWGTIYETTMPIQGRNYMDILDSLLRDGHTFLHGAQV